MALRNATLVTANGRLECDVGVKDGKIVALATDGMSADDDLDLAGLYVLPGLIDSHTHFRDPGFPELEDFESGSRGAAKGGFTTVLEMPTSLPGVSSADVLRRRAEAVQQRSVVDFGLYGAAGYDNLDEIDGMARAGAIAFKTRLRPPTPGREEAWAGQWVVHDGQYLDVLSRIAETGLISCLHAESHEIVAHRFEQLETDGLVTPEMAFNAYPAVVESEPVQRAISFSRETGTRLLLCHIARRASLDSIWKAKEAGQDVMVEAAFEQLFLTRDDVSRFGEYVPVPHVPPVEDSSVIWDAVRGHRIDQISSDHAPHTKDATEAAWRRVGEKAFGIACNELLIPFLLQKVNNNELQLETVSLLLAERPAQTYGIYPKKGALMVGADADFTIVDLKKKFTVRSSHLESKAKFTMFDGETGVGMPVATIVRGNLVMRDGTIVASPGVGTWIRGAGTH